MARRLSLPRPAEPAEPAGPLIRTRRRSHVNSPGRHELRQPNPDGPQPSDLPSWDSLPGFDIEDAYERIFSNAEEHPTKSAVVPPSVPDVPPVDEMLRSRPAEPRESASSGRRAADDEHPATAQPRPRRRARGRRAAEPLTAGEELEKARRLEQRIAEAPAGSRLARRRHELTRNPHQDGDRPA